MYLSQDLGMLLVRIIIGGVFMAHGAQKLFGWFGGYGLKGTGGFFESLGFRPGAFFAFLAGMGEFGGGLLIALGFLGPIGAVVATATMIVAVFTVHIEKGFFAQNGGYEMPMAYATAAFAIAFAGPGQYSLDYAFGLTNFDTAIYTWIGLGVALIGGFGTLVVRRPAAQPTA
jgi:putative oxidoreductase